VGTGPLTEEAQLLGAVMACGNDAALSHDHAVYSWGMLPFWIEVDLEVIHVTTPPDSRRGRRPGIAVHRLPLGADERTLRQGIPVTTTARTLVDFAGVAELRSVERAIHQALAEGTVALRQLREAADRNAPRRGASTVRRLLDAGERYDSLTRSQLEETFLRLTRGARLTEPSLSADRGIAGRCRVASRAGRGGARWVSLASHPRANRIRSRPGDEAAAGGMGHAALLGAAGPRRAPAGDRRRHRGPGRAAIDDARMIE
jgi:hypothetical protein